MAAVLLSFIKHEQRTVVCLLCVESVECIWCLSAQYGDNVLPLQCLHEWIETFKNGQISVASAEHSGCLSTSTTNNTEEQTKFTILDNRRTIIRDTTTQSDISQGLAHTNMHDTAAYHKVCAR
jgi:hypothetical protein